VATPKNLRNIYIGTSGWSITHSVAPGSRPGLTGLERYAEYFNAVEVNSTFYRSPRASTIARWRESTPPGFRFAVKVPRDITHEARLVDVDVELGRFCDLIAHVGPKLGPVLVQLPPSLALDAGVAERFLGFLTRRCPAPIVLEPRHPSWFAGTGETLLAAHGVSRAAADPACCAEAALPAASRQVAYFRWHGSPRKYFSAYLPEALSALAAQIVLVKRAGGAGREVYCFLDNTGLGAAAVNAISLKGEVLAAPIATGVTRQARPSGVDCAASPTDRARR
jgi:uncharacterized protein YecE (DUF72 family)